jgi:rhomboid protease GluP
MLRRLRSLLPDEHPATKLLIALCVGLFALMALDTFQHFNPSDPLSALLFAPPIELLLRWGAHLRGELEPWRIVMSTIIHIGLIHLLFNMSALREVGKAVENWYGSAVALFAFVLTGVGAAAASNVLGGIDLPPGGFLTDIAARVLGGKGVAAGASGGLMGLIGVMSIAGHRSGHAIGVAIRNMMLRWAFLTILLGIALGFDNVAHICGFALGAALAFALPSPSRLQRASSSTNAFKLSLVVLSLATIGAGMWGLVRSNIDQKTKDACVNASISDDDLSSTLPLCLDSLALLPSDPDLLDRVASIHLRQGHLDAAQRLYADAVPSLANMRRLLLGQLAFNRCVQFLESSQETDRSDEPSGVANRRARPAAKAAPQPNLIFFCEQAPLLLPTDPAPYNNLILAYQLTQQPAKISATCDAAKRNLPSDAASSSQLLRRCPGL